MDLEQRVSTPCVGGSNPSGGARYAALVQFGGTSACQAEGYGFEPRMLLHYIIKIDFLKKLLYNIYVINDKY